MKRLLVVLICIVFMCSAAAQADMFTPSEFFGFYRLEPIEEKTSKSGVRWCALRDVKGKPIINYSDGEKLYHVNDNPEMNDDDLPAPNIYIAFLEFCGSFDFDAYLFRADGVRLVYAADGVDISSVFNLKPVDYRDERYNDRDAFVSALEDVIYKPGSYTTAETLLADSEAVNEIRERLVESIQKLTRYEDMLYGSVLDRVEVNPNNDTSEGGDFISLVYIVYDQYTTPKNDYQQIIRAATNIATIAEKNCPEIVECCVFIDLPAYSLSAKVQFLIKDGRLEYGDVMMPEIMQQ